MASLNKLYKDFWFKLWFGFHWIHGFSSRIFLEKFVNKYTWKHFVNLKLCQKFLYWKLVLSYYHFHFCIWFGNYLGSKYDRHLYHNLIRFGSSVLLLQSSSSSLSFLVSTVGLGPTALSGYISKYNCIFNKLKNYLICKMQVEQVPSFDLDHNWHWVSSLSQIDKIIFLKFISSKLIRFEKKRLQIFFFK